jgi:PadR family transcriptional regulator, regulatory protein AphA
LSLPHAILGFLEYGPMTGYDLKKYLDQSVGHFWSTTQSHIYKALEGLEKEGMAESKVIPQEGKPNRKQYKITSAGRGELRRWVSTPLASEGPREAWLIQVFFAHNLTNEEIVHLFEKRIESLRMYLAQSKNAEKNIQENYERVGIKRMQGLWQLTLDYGTNYYETEIAWLEKTLPRVRKLPPMSPPKHR